MFFVYMPLINILMFKVSFIQIFWALVLTMLSLIKIKYEEARSEPFVSSNIYQNK